MEHDQFTGLEKRISAIEERNRRVESDKAWETSAIRIVSLGLMTYVIAALAFWMIGNVRFFLDAFVPTVAFVLSVQSLSFVKKRWLAKRK